jgi:hypothetical protein
LPCKADSECVPDHRCVPMEFQGTSLADGFCLKTVSSGCTRPYRTSIEKVSLSGVAAEPYCGIDQTVTSCVAVIDMFNDSACATDGDCGVSGKDDGRCERVSLADNRCTYSCNADRECDGGTSCGGVVVGSDYCGGGT